MVYFAKSCDTSFDDFSTGDIFGPCAFNKTNMGLWNLIAHEIVPTLIIVISCIAFVLRVIKQKNSCASINSLEKTTVNDDSVVVYINYLYDI
jgi:hypothetical protein